MPELPDVEVFRTYTEKHALNKDIESVIVNDSQILDVSAKKLKKEIEGKSFIKAERVGKQMFIKYGESQWLSMHFGMTAYPQYFEEADDEPEYSQLLFKFKSGNYFSFVCPRKFGKIGLTSSVEKFVEENDLGKDALQLDFENFKELFKKKRGKIKSALMDQKTIAGIGNIYSDEILYQSKIHPEKETKELEEEDLKEIFKVMQRVFKTAINNDAKPSELPDDYLIPNREDGKDCPKCDGKIKKIEISGRGCYFCESCQKK